MKAFFVGVGSVIAAFILGNGWNWANILKDKEYITNNERLWMAVLVSVVFLVHQTYLQLPRPVKRSVIEAGKQVIESYLKEFLDSYYALLEEIDGPGKAQPCVRANIMLPTRRAKGIFGTYLRIYYVAFRGGNAYNDQELAIRWHKKAGTCGWAWKHGDPCMFDSKDPRYNLPAQRLKESCHDAVMFLNSTLSVPIWDAGADSPVGVLNLDSKDNVDKTRFEDNAVYILASACARTLVAHCRPGGVTA